MKKPRILVTSARNALPEDEELIGAVSRYIKTHENGAKEIDEMEFSKNFEEDLRKLVGLV